MRRFSKTLLPLVGAAIILIGWDTMVTDPIPWQSAYQTGEPKSIPEHSNVADLTFEYLDPSGKLVAMFGRKGSAEVTTLDLNASHFRKDVFANDPGYGEHYGNNDDTEVEERLIPPPANFAGLPDYSYAMYDWLNKNKTCPSFNQAEYKFRCHEFKGWLGALNSVHFGSQAKDMYAHYHKNALALATKAAKLRAAMSEDERKAHHELLLEAEHAALAYEGYAQHFLQDRWAMGHMWERWGSPDDSQIDRWLLAHLAIGGLSGEIHGTEAITGIPDQLSSPLPGDDTNSNAPVKSIPMEFVHVNAKGGPTPIPAIGDERLQDAIAGVFRLSKYDPKKFSDWKYDPSQFIGVVRDSHADQYLDVSQQKESLMRCAGAGWAETIRALGPGKSAGTFGAYEAPLSSDAPSFSIIGEQSCWDMWATNKSMVTGLLGTNPGLAITAMGTTNVLIDPLGYGQTHGSRTQLTKYAARMWLYARSNPNGTEIAQGKMKSISSSLASWVGYESDPDMTKMWGFKQGGAYEIPDYVEPIGLVNVDAGATDVSGEPALPWEDLRGRDIQTLYGVFNQAHSDYWCENRDTLKEVRALNTKKGEEICQRFADMAYQGTHPFYDGSMKRTRKHNDADVQSVCALHNKGVEDRDVEDQDNPFWLNQGYTPFESTNNEEHPFTSYDEVANWCARVPILTLSVEEASRNENIAAEIYPDAETLTLAGRDLGYIKGKITATDPDGEIIELDDITDWSDERIVIDTSDIEWEENTRYRLKLKRGEQHNLKPLETVGLFYLNVDEQANAPIKRQILLDLGGKGPCGDAVPEFDFIDLAASMPKKENHKAIKKMLKTYRKDLKKVKPYLERQLQCMKDLRAERLPVIETFFEDYPEKFEYTEGTLKNFPPEAPYIRVSDPNSKSSTDLSVPQLDLNSSLWGGLNVNVEHSADAPYIWDGDIYTPYIDNLAGIIRFLEGSELLLSAWDITFAEKDEFFTSGGENSPHLGVQVSLAKDVADLRKNIFVNLKDDPKMRKLVKSRRSRSRLEDRRWDLARVDISTTGLALDDLFERLSTGLGPWTQIQHALTQVAIPKATSEISYVESELKRTFKKELAEAIASCEYDQQGRCPLYGPYGKIDDAELVAITTWINDLYRPVRQSLTPLMPMMDAERNFLETPSFRLFAYVDENERRRTFLYWPSDEANEVARNWPEGIETSYYEYE